MNIKGVLFLVCNANVRNILQFRLLFWSTPCGFELVVCMYTRGRSVKELDEYVYGRQISGMVYLNF